MLSTPSMHHSKHVSKARQASEHAGTSNTRALQARKYVSTPARQARKHANTPGTQARKARQHVSTQTRQACEHAST